jgi:hypothetical protein
VPGIVAIQQRVEKPVSAMITGSRGELLGLLRVRVNRVTLQRMSTSPKTLEEILVQARHFPEDQRRRLVADLQVDKSALPSESRRKHAMKRWLARAGSAHAGVTNISGSKNKYLAEIYATKP